MTTIVLSWRKFRKVFGFDPTADVEEGWSPYVGIAEQQLVADKLRKFAQEFAKEDERERQLGAELREAVKSDRLVSLRDQLKVTHRRIHEVKDAFWLAHQLAKKAGFTVEPRYTDYLPSKYR